MQRLISKRTSLIAGLACIPSFTWIGWCLSSDHPIQRAKISYNMPIRLARDIYTALSIITDYQVSLYGIEDKNTRKAITKECHQRSANKILDLCFANGGIYIKLGQHVGQMEHLLPEEYVKTMQENVLDKCPLTPYLTVKQTIEDNLGMSIEKAYSKFEPNPVASASLAQVHLAYGSNGEKYAVKVQHPGLNDASAADIITVDYIVKAIKWIFPKFDYTWLVSEIKKNLPRELNFRLEAENAEMCRKNLNSSKSKVKGRVYVPEVITELSSEKVLTMEYIDGIRVTDKEGLKELGLKARQVARLVAQTFNEMIFVFGNIHCDPHAANLFIRKSKNGEMELVLLDHGLYQNITEEFRHDYAALWKSLVFGDADGIKKHSLRMNAGDLYPIFAAMLTYQEWDQITKQRSDHLELKFSKIDKSKRQRHAQQYSQEITELLLKMPRELILLLKTNDCLRCIDKSLGQNINNLMITARECTRALAEQKAAKAPSWFSSASYLLDMVYLECRLFLLRALTLFNQIYYC